ncbi:ABC transporter ATP-binding protein [Sulfitobacter sp. S190]|uniref:ABC transporter ATP-binding protein n=1 Tax=Sulfitobacter sp. S190 TaxID=2867022 RepID=UPI00220A3635|nr:sn-glycerol-3-phosphate ABC transporter ATP-binding protein UgpC [Sulfitobacter sp. S190]UWR23916.1 sn-glycerol-3-phosphate ABC transporter ATP-binding protein UgpC [Sulfitobacter sp. S190]
MSNLSLRDINKLYGSTHVMHDVSLEIEKGEFTVFVGPSGCGKSTLLRMIAGLESISSGELYIGDQLMNAMPSSKRGIAMVFQSYALYPHMSVFENMAFSLRIAKTPNDIVKEKVTNAARILQLEEYLDRLPKALSGGQRQRVAIGRAIVREPSVFLFDEPLSNLDAELRVRTRIEIAKLKESMPDTTMIYVTHDQVEAMTLADKIVVLRAGRVEQVGAPMTLYNEPINQFVAGFIGSPQMNFFDGDDLASGPASHVTGIRPEHMVEVTENPMVSGTLDLVEQMGEYVLVHMLTSKGTRFTAKMPHKPTQKIGETIHFSPKGDSAHRFDAQSGLRLVD